MSFVSAVSRVFAVALVTLGLVSGSGRFRDAQIYVGTGRTARCRRRSPWYACRHELHLCRPDVLPGLVGRIMIDRIESINPRNGFTIDGFMLSRDNRELDRFGAGVWR
jgi:hypothetical protein